ncbi:MAG: PAS domain S-box protein [Gammaproteobacteria bacterium]|nr:PAS domain S-box protein [Gammaproteobacteria bacterium]
MSKHNFYLVITSIIIIVLLSSSAWITQNSIENRLHNDIEKALGTVLDTTSHALKSWADREQKDAVIWADRQKVREAAKILIDTPRDRQTLLNIPIQAELQKWFESVIETKGHHGYLIIAPDNIIIASHHNENIGIETLLTQQIDFLNRIWAGKTAMSIPLESDISLPDENDILKDKLPTMFVGAPIFNENKQVIAAFTFRINPYLTFTSILQEGRIGNSGESYAFNDDGLMISQSRFDKQLRDLGLLENNQRGILNIRLHDPGINLVTVEKRSISSSEKPLTYMAEQAIAGKSGVNLDGYRDYRGVYVLGAWLWDNTLGFGITTEIDVEEAYKSQFFIRNTVLILTVISILLIATLLTIFRVNRKQLVQSEKELRSIVNHAPVPMVITDPDGFIKLFNYKFEETFGWTIKDIQTPKQWWVAAYPDREYRQKVQASWENAINRAVETKSEIKKQHWKVNCKDGSVKDVDFTMSSISEKFSVIAMVDLTERIKVASDLKYERDRTNQYLETIETIIIVLDKKGNISLVNRKGCEILGYRKQEMIGKNWFTTCLAHKKHEHILYEEFLKTMDGVKGNNEAYESTVLTKKGNLRLVAWQNSLLNDKEGNISGTLSAGQDITELRASENERKELQNQLVESQKMKAISLLSAGVAHNFNNMLASIMGYVELAEKEVSGLDNVKLESYLDHMMTSSNRAINLVKQMLAFSQQKRMVLLPQLIQDLVLDSIDIINSAISSNVHINIQVEDTDAVVLLDTTSFRQAVINICINASDAMNGKGELDILLNSINVENEKCQSCSHAITGNYVVLEIKDYGCGIATKVLPHIFDPFFSTKNMAEATGMGLSTVHGIMHNHNGHIQVQSSLDIGTTVSLYFPV